MLFIQNKIPHTCEKSVKNFFYLFYFNKVSLPSSFISLFLLKYSLFSSNLHRAKKHSSKREWLMDVFIERIYRKAVLSLQADFIRPKRVRVILNLRSQSFSLYSMLPFMRLFDENGFTFLNYQDMTGMGLLNLEFTLLSLSAVSKLQLT